MKKTLLLMLASLWLVEGCSQKGDDESIESNVNDEPFFLSREVIQGFSRDIEYRSWSDLTSMAAPLILFNGVPKKDNRYSIFAVDLAISEIHKPFESEKLLGDDEELARSRIYVSHGKTQFIYIVRKCNIIELRLFNTENETYRSLLSLSFPPDIIWKNDDSGFYYNSGSGLMFYSIDDGVSRRLVLDEDYSYFQRISKLNDQEILLHGIRSIDLYDIESEKITKLTDTKNQNKLTLDKKYIVSRKRSGWFGMKVSNKNPRDELKLPYLDSIPFFGSIIESENGFGIGMNGNTLIVARPGEKPVFYILNDFKKIFGPSILGFKMKEPRIGE
ncbi:hypothetical protein HF888_10555 [Bermanella marisrubri]|nr:hypothetical protein [Bermanella marisrubri]QIZ84629.1 hypothetical protein HF888_10555 [Bermanella marisrubri]